MRIPYAASRDQIHHWLRLCCDSLFTCIFLRSFRHHFKTIGGTEMADVEQTQKMFPFVTCACSQGLQQSDPIYQEREYRAALILRPKR